MGDEVVSANVRRIGKRDYRAVVNVDAVYVDGSETRCVYRFVGHVTRSGKLQLHVDWKHSSPDS